MTRRGALALLAGALVGCRPGAAAAPQGAPAPALKLEPLVGLAPAAGLIWLVDARPADLLALPAVVSAVSVVLPAERFDAFARRHGGVDLRRATELVVAGYEAATLALAHTPVEPGRVEAAFAARAAMVEGRAVEGGVTRFWGNVGGERQQVGVFGAEAVGLELGRLGPLRAAEYFAQGKLKRASPALSAEPLARVAALLGDAPARAFAPGPFTGPWAKGLGGLLGASTAAAIAARPVAGDQAPGGALDVQVLLAGAWGKDASAAAERLGASFQLLANDSLGRLMGLDHPLEEPRVSGDGEALRLGVLLGTVALARGLHAATDARITEIMAY
jgi:hypothetical protein